MVRWADTSYLKFRIFISLVVSKRAFLLVIRTKDLWGQCKVTGMINKQR